MRTWVGTSGYNYPEWKGSFYPQKLPAAKMLPFYAQAFSSVEVNYTFYRMPNARTVAGWDRDTPAGFKLTLKAPKRITHIAKLRDCTDALQYFLGVAATLGDKLGAILFQLPPWFRKDLAVLEEFLALLPAQLCAAFEFRHASWMDGEVFARLRARNIALCVADSERFSTPVEITAGCVAGHRSSASTPLPAATCTSTSSMRRQAPGRSSRGCCSRRWEAEAAGPPDCAAAARPWVEAPLP